MKKTFLLTILFLFTATVLLAGGPMPCNGADIDEQCPLDTWVIGLAAVAMILACVQLTRKQKAAIKAA